MNKTSKTPIRVLSNSNPKAKRTAFLKKGIGLFYLWLIWLLMAFVPNKSFVNQSITQIKIIIQQELQKTSLQNLSDSHIPPPILSPCPGGSGIIGGVAFQDFNHNGDNDQVGSLGGVQIAIFSCDEDGNSTLIGTTTTDADGNYFFDGLNDGATYRLQFSLPANLDHFSAGSGSGEAGTDVQFVQAPSCEAHIGYLDVNDFCEEDPFIIAACYVNGDPLAPNSGSADEEAIVAFRYSSSGNDPITKLALAEEVGATYGLAWQKSTQRIFASAFIKRHVGLGPLGIGGLYVIDWSTNTPVVSPFIDVKTIGVDAGDMISNADRGLSTNPAFPNNDASAYNAVGKWGLGGLDTSSDEQSLWLMSLNNRTLYSIEIDSDNNFNTPPTSSDVTAFPLPQGGCSGGSLRPFAVKYYQGEVYVGAVCDAAISQNADDLEAIVYRLNGNSFVEALRFDLDYPKGYTTFSHDCEDFTGWYPWRDDLPPACSSNGIFRVYPTPIFSDMVFDTDGSLIMGFTDRMGHQIGFKNYPLEGTSPLLQTVSGGDILRAFNDNGTFVLENNATAGTITTNGVDNEQGPGGGEFYYRDVFEGPIDNLVDPQPHLETAQGGLALVLGNGEVVTTALDPYSTLFNSGGVNWLNNSTAQERNPGFILYRTSTTDISTFSKANGLGDIAALCGLPPLEIGSYVWEDLNENGLQDACEPPIDNINVALLDSEGNILASTTTDEKGEFYFNDETPNFIGLQPNTSYVIAIGTEGDFDITTGMLTGRGTITTANVMTTGTDSDKIDSDAAIANNNIAGGAITGLPFIQITTGGVGFTDHSFDIGFISSPPSPVIISGVTWHDENLDGIRDTDENFIEGVIVQLFTEDGTLVGTTTSNVDGFYEFEVNMGGLYYVVFELNPMLGDDNFELTIQNAGDDTIDSDPNATTGQTNSFSVVLGLEGLSNIDAGYILIILENGSIGDFVFKDCNQNGIQDSEEEGIAGITVTLTHATTGNQMNTTTNVNGFYIFNDLAPGIYRLRFSIPVASGLEFTIAHQGNNNALDSDVNSNGITDDIILSEGEENNVIDAGLVDVETPTFSTALPQDMTLDCNESPPSPPTLMASDNCDSEVEIMFTTNMESNNDCAGGTMIRTWEAIDDCGNSVSHSQAIVFRDNTPPVFNGVLPADMEGLECSDFDLNNPPILTATDNCDPNVVVSFLQEVEDNISDCAGGTLRRTWTATDDCGNQTTHVQHITFDDNTPPIITGVPEDVSIDCDDIPGMPIIKGIDNCGEEVELVFTQTQEGDCPLVITRTWTAIDNCGNQTSDSQLITVIDTVPPVVFYNNPDLIGMENGDTLIVDCDNIPVLTNLDVNVFDNCDADLDVEFVDFVINTSDCIENGFLAYMFCGWIVQDDCGNVTELTIHILVVDEEPPTLIGIPDDVFIGQNGELPDIPEVIASDNCDDNVQIDFIQESITESCGAVVKRTWIANDDCGNQDIEVQLLILSANCDCPTAIINNHSTQNADCGMNNGAASIDLTGNPSDYIITWTPNIGISNATNTERSNLPTGVYTVQAQYAFSEECFEKIVFEIEGEQAANPNVGITAVSCAGGSDGVIVSQDGRLYSISQNGIPIGTSPVFNISAGNYTISYENNDGCSTAIDIIVPEPSALQIVTDSAPVTCAGGDGAISLTTNGGSGNYSYQWSPDVSSTSFANNLDAGTYGITVTDDANCFEIINVIILDECHCDLALSTSTEDATCGMNNGSIVVNIEANIFGNLLYTWSPNVSNSNLAMGLAVGTYSITVMDAISGCEASTIATIGTVDLPQTPDVRLISPSCFGSCDGVINANNNQVYSIFQNNIEIGQTPLNNLCAGNYTVQSIDDNNCNISINVDVEEPTTLSASFTIEQDSCNLGVGRIAVSASGGSGNYTYHWMPNVSNEATANNLNEGSYTIVIRDANACELNIDNIVIENIDCPLECNLEITETHTNTICGENNGSIEVTVSNALGNIIYNWNPDVSDDAYVDGLEAGVYMITAIDDMTGCVAESMITIEQEAMPEMPNVNVTNQSCAGILNGSISSNDGRVYTILRNHAVVGQTPISELGADTYTITFTDENNCTRSLDVEVTAPAPLSLEAIVVSDTCEMGLGSITLEINGGNEPYTYEWSEDISTTSNAIDLSIGTYSVTATDENACSIALNDINVANTCPCNLEATATIYETSCGESNGSISIDVAGGSELSYQWSGSNSTTHVANNLDAGDYSVTITDAATACSITLAATVEALSTPEPPSITVINTSCPNEEDGGIYSNDGRTYLVLQNEEALGVTPATFLSPGNYEVQFTDQNACMVSTIATIDTIEEFKIIVETFGTSCSSKDGRIKLNAMGGTAPYRYLWQGNLAPITSNKATNLETGSYGVTILDANDCSYPVVAEIQDECGLSQISSFHYEEYSIELIDDQEEVIIHWTTKNETSIGHFYIERSTDSLQFHTLPFITEGKGSFNEFNTYKITDENPRLGWNYYRILYINASGKTFRTEVLKVFLEPLDGSEVLIYPNPFRNEILLDFLYPLETDANVQIIDAWGQILKKETVLKGTLKHRLDLSQYPIGMYFVYVAYNKHRKAIHRVVKGE